MLKLRHIVCAFAICSASPLCAQGTFTPADFAGVHAFENDGLDTIVILRRTPQSSAPILDTASRAETGTVQPKTWCSDLEHESIGNSTLSAAHLASVMEGGPANDCRHDGQARARARTVSAFIDMGDSMSNRIMYKYHKSQVHEFEIASLLKLYPGILEALRAKFGSPAGDKNTSVMNIYRPS